MKYILLFLALGLGYEVYTNWTDLRPKYEEMFARVASATASVRSAKTAQVREPIVIPGQIAPGVWPSATVAPQPASLGAKVAASQKQAIAKYPALCTANSELNSRFVFRYKRMLSEKSPRLQDPTWPMQLADECSEAIAASNKPKVKTPLVDTPRQAGSLAAAGQTAAAGH